MRPHDGWLQWALLATMLLAGAHVHAQIYACTAKDGSRVFSDERCGPDAKVVPNITTRKRLNAPTGARPRTVTAAKSPAELEKLLKVCNAGDVTACNAWTHGGGPNWLREQERRMELACEGGSLAQCEQRYCRDGATSECRTRVLEAASISGATWYLRREDKREQGGATQYEIRCIHEGVRDTRDVTVSCSALAGPQRCRNAQSQQTYPRLDQAANSSCARQP